MNKIIKIRYTAILLVAFLISTATAKLWGQAGMTIYVGPSVAFSGDNVVTAGGEAHFGYVIGANARLNSDFMYFMLTGEYGTFDLVANKKWNFIGGDDLVYFRGKIGLGFDLKKLSSRTTLRTKFQGTLLFVNDYDQNWINNDARLAANGYTKINEGIAGLSTCLGLTIGSFDLDLDYDHGLYNLYTGHKSSKISTISLCGGFRF
ncbi:MAG TPA: hypothetical protein PLQ57_09245 [Saprospiraceae bacterium]|nr:hypothetical protein [Saprospiraceae bacterium]HRG21205.1 hypothetical protein [Saprospiraceae bacterium]